METLYRKVAVSERLPDKSKWNCDYFLLEFNLPRKGGMFIQGFVHNGLFINTYREGYSTINTPFDPQPEYWYEEIPATIKSDNTAVIQTLEAEKTELLEALYKSNEMLKDCLLEIKDYEDIEYLKSLTDNNKSVIQKYKK